MRRMFDAAWPPTRPPAWEVVAGYIGGNTPHVWTDAEWSAQPARWRLPIFVRSHDGDPNADAAGAVSWLRAHGVPPGCTLALDYETRVDAAYLQAFDWIVTQAGYQVVVYGSRDFVLRNPEPSGGYWDAEWTNVPHLNPGSVATQYGGDVSLGKPYDASLVADFMPLWDTQKEDPLVTFTTQDLQDAAYIGAKRALNEGTGAGQLSWSKTEQAILGTVQALVNLVRAAQGTLAGSIGDLRSAVLGAVAALPVPETDEQAQATAQRILDALAGLGVEGLSADAILEALRHHPLAPVA